jgi:2-polyprenyl-3-methyl-5-hydroxy-6-metoxy-1,4-benzoquinol methylase
MDATYTGAYSRLYREHWWWRVRERILLREVRKILGGRAPDARMLDVGCGAALFFDALQAFGHVEGIESDRIAVEQSGRWRERIHHGELATFQTDRAYDLVLLLDVLEHVPHPEPLLRESARLLTPGGALLVTVPAFDWLWTSHDDLNHHVKRYTAGEVRQLLRSAGLEVASTRYLFQSLIVPKLLVRAKESLMPSSASVPRIPRRLVNAAIERWFSIEDGLAGALPFGSSVLAVARRL